MFGNVRCDEAFKTIEEHFPEVTEWILMMYNTDTRMFYGNRVVLGEESFDQCDPLSILFIVIQCTQS